MVDLRAEISQRKPKAGQVFFIAVDGRGGSGKSSLAAWLSERLSAEVVHTDDFASWDNPLDWWSLLIKRVFSPIQNGTQTLSYPRSNWSDGHAPTPIVEQPVTSIMILEGVSSSRKEFRDFISMSIFLDTPKETSFSRGLARDASLVASPDKLKSLWNDWVKEEDAYIQRDNPREFADILIDGTRSFESQIKV